MRSTLAGVGTWWPAAPEVPRRLVVVAPHPDDEVLGAAGILRWAADEGAATTIVACTDGESSHVRSSLIDPADLRRVRAEERAAALAALQVEADVLRLSLPDGAVRAHEDELTEALGSLGEDGTTFIVPWVHDGHPDHEAVARAALAAAVGGTVVWQVPIWAKVRTTRPRPSPVATLHLSAGFRAVKARAVACFRSQLIAVGPSSDDGPVVHPHELAAMLDGSEVVLA